MFDILKNTKRHGERGQALIEYALILVLVVIALIAAVAATGPALGNVFSNTVCNLISTDGGGCALTPQNLVDRGGPSAFWATVTHVAANPPEARGFPTSPPRPPTLTPTAGPSPTPSPVTPSKTPTNTPTQPPTATATDAAFNIPHVDPIDQPVWWRVDSSVYLGSDDWRGEYFSNVDLSGVPDRVLFNQQIGPEHKLNLNFNWGNNSPIDGWLTDGFSVRWTRPIYVFGTDSLTITFTLDSNDGSRLIIDGTTVINYWSDHNTGSPRSVTQTLAPGPHTLVVEFYDRTGGAAVSLGMSTSKGNTPADTNKATGAANCPWTQINGSQPNTLTWAWKENLASVTNGFPQNMRCNLELRGYVDLTNVTNPTMSFWDVWDFGSTSDTSVRLQLAAYAPYNADGSGGPNWAGGQEYVLHTGGKNYAWTRNELPIPNLGSNQVTWRFVMDSGAATSVRRWYLDDVKVISAPAARTFGVCTVSKYTCGSFWDLDRPQQKNDFITSGRWDLTTTNGASNDTGVPSMSWDIRLNTTNSGRYDRFGSEQGSTDFRIHYIAFDGLVDLRDINADGSGGALDWESDSGLPILSFYHAFDLERGDSIEVQYTRDTDMVDGTPAVWQRVGTSAIRSVSTSGSRVTQAMQKYELQLNQVPNWNTTPFRLRFALLVNNSNEAQGWFIDNIAIERIGIPQYTDYPFCDDAETGIDNWLMGGQWGITNTSGAFQTGRSFTDSPLGNYVNGQDTSMTLRYPIDFNNDTPENLPPVGDGNLDCNRVVFGAATRPYLTFWHWRRLAANENFHVELTRSAHGASGTTAIGPTAIWSYNYNSTDANQIAWERVEIDLQGAIESLTGVSWATLVGNANRYDDDFTISFRLDARSNSSVSDGVYIDNIRIQNYAEGSYKLWSPGTSITPVAGAPAAGAGSGTNYFDNIDFPDDWYNRWTSGGDWTSIDWDRRSGVQSMHDSATNGANYRHQTYNVLELTPIIDMRGTQSTDLPTMYFWHRYWIGGGDSIQVQVAVQDQNEMVAVPPTRNRQGYNYIYRWGSSTSYSSSTSWETIYTIGENSRNNAWTRVQLDLRNYAGRRIKVRFVLNALQNSNVRTGWWLDDFQITFRTAQVFTVPFFDAAQNMRNWIGEGNWGLSPDQWRGSGGGAADLGPGNWTAYWFDCRGWTYNPSRTTPTASDLNETGCDVSTWSTWFNAIPRTVAGTDAFIAARPALTQPNYYIKDFTTEINYDMGSSDRPPGGFTNTWYDQFGARFIRTITVSGGEYTFISTSDDGVRVRVDPGPSSPFWNAINNWTFHGRTVNLGTLSLAAGTYTVVVEYFEGSGDAVIQLQVGTNRFSFSDSPKAGVGSSFPVINSTNYSNQSLLLDGVINLNTPSGYTSTTWRPRLEFWTLFAFESNTYGAVEVSTNGGFTWTQTNLSNNCPIYVWPQGPFCDPNIWGYDTWTPADGDDWRQQSHDLRSYINQNIGVRFRLFTSQYTRDGWWITDIQVNNNAND
ncbi:MAG: hypothetical protein J0L63_00865 [Anaerolineae bacterium]|nr:hypothetical protein [Anaerolineae bacterium]